METLRRAVIYASHSDGAASGLFAALRARAGATSGGNADPLAQFDLGYAVAAWREAGAHGRGGGPGHRPLGRRLCARPPGARRARHGPGDGVRGGPHDPRPDDSRWSPTSTCEWPSPVRPRTRTSPAPSPPTGRSGATAFRASRRRRHAEGRLRRADQPARALSRPGRFVLHDRLQPVLGRARHGFLLHFAMRPFNQYSMSAWPAVVQTYRPSTRSPLTVPFHRILPSLALVVSASKLVTPSLTVAL